MQKFPSSSLVTPEERKPAAKRKDAEDNETSSPYFKRQKSAVTCETASLTASSLNSSFSGQSEQVADHASETEAKALSITSIEKEKAVAQNDLSAEENISDEQSDQGSSEIDGDDEEEDEDRPFQVDRAPTGRASCRTCDENIARGCLRVSHAPLFRGKPGFRVFRHLECALFSDEVIKPQDVGGWKKLSKDELEMLTLRIEEARLEQELENEELQPDELVQVTFQGETRKPPPGLVASLLPFQVEGISWMYHQEVNVPEIRGGILADEMGMVRRG
jgi:SNF2 family DNA or RNA helicase